MAELHPVAVYLKDYWAEKRENSEHFCVQSPNKSTISVLSRPSYPELPLYPVVTRIFVNGKTKIRLFLKIKYENYQW